MQNAAAFLDPLIRETARRHMEARPTQTIELLDFCVHTKHQELCSEALLSRIKNPTRHELEGTIVPLMAKVTEFLARHSLSPCRESYATFYKSAMLAWVNIVLGPKPEDFSKRIADTRLAVVDRCSCKHCQGLADALSDHKQESVRFWWSSFEVDPSVHLLQNIKQSGAGSLMKRTRPKEFEVRL